MWVWIWGKAGWNGLACGNVPVFVKDRCSLNGSRIQFPGYTDASCGPILKGTILFRKLLFYVKNALCLQHFPICVLSGSWELTNQLINLTQKLARWELQHLVPSTPSSSTERGKSQLHLEQSHLFDFIWKLMVAFCCYSLEAKVLLSRDRCKKFSFRDAQIIAFFQCVCHILLSQSTSDQCLSTKQTVSYPKQTSQLSGFIPLVFCFEHMKCHRDLF